MDYFFPFLALDLVLIHFLVFDFYAWFILCLETPFLPLTITHPEETIPFINTIVIVENEI